MSITMGGFSGDNALLAFAAVQQGRMNDELNESMRAADVRSQMAQDLASIKAHLDGANRNSLPGKEGFVKPEGFIELEKEIQAFLAKYGDDPACADMMSAMGEVGASVSQHVKEYQTNVSDAGHGYNKAYADWERGGRRGLEPQHHAALMPAYEDGDIKKMAGQLQETLDAAGTNDQLTMIHIKQLNDNMNNSSGMVSGIMESRQNTTASIINNLA